MNCCEQNAPYTGCNQGRNCPVRSSRITADESFEAARLMDAARIQDARRVHRTSPADAAIPPEAGNVWFVPSELDPLNELDDPDEWRPLSTTEYVLVGGGAIIFIGAWVALLAIAVGYASERWGAAARHLIMGLLS